MTRGAILGTAVLIRLGMNRGTTAALILAACLFVSFSALAQRQEPLVVCLRTDTTSPIGGLQVFSDGGSKALLVMLSPDGWVPMLFRGLDVEVVAEIDDGRRNLRVHGEIDFTKELSDLDFSISFWELSEPVLTDVIMITETPDGPRQVLLKMMCRGWRWDEVPPRDYPQNSAG